MAIKNLGSIVKKHSSGMVESDKGRRFPYIKADIGDIMLETDDGIIIVTKEVFAKTYRKEIRAQEAEDKKKISLLDEDKGEENA